MSSNESTRPQSGGFTPRRGPGGGGPGGPMMMGPAQKAKDFKGTLRRLLRYLKPHSVRMVVVFLLAVASTVFTIASPKIMGQVMNKVKDSFMARIMITKMSEAQGKAREAILNSMKAPMPAQDSARPAQDSGPTMPSPETRKLIADFMALPELSSVSSNAQKAQIVRSMIDMLKAMPSEATSMLGPQANTQADRSGAQAGKGGAMSSIKLTEAQLEDAVKSIEKTGGSIDYMGMLTILGFLLALYGLSALFTFASGWLMSSVSQKTVYDLRREVDAKLKRLPLRYFDSRSHGEVLSRVTNDVDTIANTLQQSLTQAITSIVQIVGFTIMMLSISRILTLVVLASMPLYVLAMMTVAKRSQKFFGAQQKELGAISGHVEESFSGHAVVKAFGREQRAIAEFDAINQRLAEAGWKAQFVSGIMMPAMFFIGNLAYVCISVLGGIWMTKARLNLGDITAFIQYSRSFNQPIQQAANIANIIQSTIACAERVFEVLDEEEEMADPAQAKMPQSIRGEVRIQDLAFSYKSEEPLIRNLSLDVKPGHTIAIVGPTGAGKTTLVNLLMRFYEIQGGSITLDGVNAMDMPRSGLRSLYGMVLQDTWLFNGTIRENILYGRQGASEEEMVRAAKAAHADHFIRTLPEGYETVLNEEASNISQGQKQLLTIARAILANPAILILDEATSSVDTRTEVLIQKAMAALMENRTSFVIAHRLSTIRDAELILVMDKGDIVEQGSHAELLAKGGFYAELYHAQFSGVPQDAA